MPDDLYTRDILEWSGQQAALLRRLAAGERVNAAVDWPHVIEEVADVGRAELHACESLLRQAMVHLLKLHSGEDAPARHWRAEVVGFLADAAQRYTESMRQRIELDRIYRRALHQAREATRAKLADAPANCPWDLPQLLDEAADLDTLLAALGPSFPADKNAHRP